jgi:hypothetical protein
MHKYKAKFQDEAGYYHCTWYCEGFEDFWSKVYREERIYKSKFIELNQD